MTTECPICCDKFNKSTRARVVCPYGDCAQEACRACVKTYLTSITDDPNCMRCHLALTDEFLSGALTKTFITKEYRAHRSFILAERELARMPETMGLAAAEREARNHDQQVVLVRQKIEAAVQRINALRDLERQHLRQAYRARHPNQEEVAASARRFTMPCPRADCRGFLSTQYKCGVCEHFVCPDCFAEKGTDRDEEHTCNPDDVATVTAIKNESKPCPSCGARISKVSGCDQMWCVGCHVAFSWRTGQIQHGVVHNPHFFEYQRASGGRGVGANRAHGQCNAERMPDWHIFRASVNTPLLAASSTSLRLAAVIRTVQSVFQIGVHIERVEIPQTTDTINNLQDNTQLRVRYILNEIDKETLTSTLGAADRKRKRLVESMQITQLVYAVIKESMWALVDAPQLVQTDDSSRASVAPLAEEAIKRFMEVADYANERWRTVSKTHGGVVMPCITSRTTTSRGREGGHTVFELGKQKFKRTTNQGDAESI